MLSSVSTPATQSVTAADGPGGGGKRTFQIVNIATGTSTATAIIQASNDGTNCIPRGTITAVGTGATVTAGVAIDESWSYWRAALTTNGTNSVTSVICGLELDS